MNTCSYILMLCFGVVLSARLTIALRGSEMELLMTKLNYLQDKLHEVERSTKAAMEEMEYRLQEKLIKHEKNINDRFVSKMHAMEYSLKMSVQASEENTRTKLEELKNMIPKMDHIQEPSQNELKKLGENKEILEMLTNSIHNLTINVEARSKTLEDHLIAPIRSCRQVTGESGTYMFRLRKNSKPFEVFCEQNKFNGSWIVIQHIFDGSVDFHRNWAQYRNGFGNVEGEFWLGLEYVHQITKNRPHELLIDGHDINGKYVYIKYGEFEIGDESEKYVLKKVGPYSGTVENNEIIGENLTFSTFDRDNDEWKDGNCAEFWRFAWWYKECGTVNTNREIYENHTMNIRLMIRDILD